MSVDTAYNLVLTGKLIPGYDKAKAVQYLARCLHASTDQAATLLLGKSRVIKKNLSRENSTKFLKSLTSRGIDVHVLASSTSDAPATEAPSTKTSAKVHHIFEARGPKQGSQSISKVRSTTKRTPGGASQRAQNVAQEKSSDNNIFNGVLQYQQTPLLQQLSLLAASSALIVMLVLYAGVFFSALVFSLERLSSLVFWNEASGLFMSLAMYVLPAVFAACLCGVMLRPVLAKVEKKGVALRVQHERSLLNFVRQLAVMLGAPVPKELVITDEFGVEAEFSPSVKAVKDAEIRLRIGLPVLMTLDLPSFAGAIASAMSRFDDKTGMYLQYIIRELNRRLEAAYNNDDSWQGTLERLSSEQRGRTAHILVKLWLPIVFVSRYVALPCLLAVRAVSARVNRNQCYREDQYFSAVAGVRHFVAHFKQLYLAKQAYGENEANLHQGISSKKFVNDLPALSMHTYKNFSAQVRSQAEDEVVETSTAWSDMLPCNRDRMIAAEEHDYDGIVAVDTEAYRLLSDLKDLSRKFTLAFYAAHDYSVREEELVDAKDLAISSNEERKRDEVCKQYFNAWFDAGLFFQTNQFAYACSISKQQRIVEINEIIKIIRRSTPDFQQLKSAVPAKFERYAYSRFALDVHKAGYGIDNTIAGMESVNAANLSAYNSSRRKEYEGGRAQQRDLCKVMGERLCFALAFLRDDKERKVAEHVLSVLSVLEAQANQLEALRAAVFLVPHFQKRIRDNGETKHGQKLRRLSREIFTTYELMVSEFSRFRWPFSKEFDTFADYFKQGLPATDAAQAENDKSVAQVNELDQRLALYQAMWDSLRQANRYLNGKIAPLAQKAELENNIARIKMTVSAVKAS